MLKFIPSSGKYNVIFFLGLIFLLFLLQNCTFVKVLRDYGNGALIECTDYNKTAAELKCEDYAYHIYGESYNINHMNCTQEYTRRVECTSVYSHTYYYRPYYGYGPRATSCTNSKYTYWVCTADIGIKNGETNNYNQVEETKEEPNTLNTNPSFDEDYYNEEDE